MGVPCNRNLRRAGLVLVLALALAACAGKRASEIDGEFAWERTAAEQTSPLSGENLAQMRQEMKRAHRDMKHFHATLRDLRHRRDRSGYILFSSFMGAYMGMHLDPLTAGEWQARHPELMALDANLRLAKAEVLIQMRATGEIEELIQELGARFQGRESMLVEYPLGQQSTLGEALQSLRDRKWRG